MSNNFCGNAVLADVRGVCCSDLHCNVFAVFCKAFFICYIGGEFYHNADGAAAVNISCYIAFITDEAANFEVFTDFELSVLKMFVNGSAVNNTCEESFNVCRIVVDNSLSCKFYEFTEIFVFGNEVGFGVNFDCNGNFLFCIGECENKTFSSDSAGFFCNGCKAFFTKEFNCFFHVAIGFDESFFAVEHSAFGHFAESFNVLSGKGHIILPPLQILQEDSVHPVCLQ